MKILKTFEGFGKKDDVRFIDAIDMSYNWEDQIKLDYDKIAKTIKSLDKLEQEKTISKMISNFYDKYETPMGGWGSIRMVKGYHKIEKRVKELRDELKRKIEELEDEIKISTTGVHKNR